MVRTSIRERQASGIAAARAIGKRWGGRKSGTGIKVDPQRIIELKRSGLTNGEVAAALSVSTRTLIRATKRANGESWSSG